MLNRDEFVAALEGRDTHSFEGLQDLSDGLGAWLRSRWWEEEIARLRARTTSVLMEAEGGTWRVYDGPTAAISVEEPDPTAWLYGSPSHRLVGALTDAMVFVYRHTQAWTPGRFDPGCGLSAPIRVALRRGDVLPLRAWRDVIHAERGWLATVAGPCVDTISWVYDPDTRQPDQPLGANPRWNHILSALDVLCASPDPRAIPALDGLRAHPAHFVRWAAVQAQANADPESLIELLKKASGDPHPDIRAAVDAAQGPLHADAETKRP